MRGIAATLAALGLVLTAPALAQGNDDDYTPLNSRIKRDRQFPTDLLPRFGREQMSKVNRARSRMMLSQFTKCLYRRSNEKSLALLEKTDLGFTDFQQIGLSPDSASRQYGFKDCLRHVATVNATGAVLRFTAAGLRSWLLREAYFSAFPDAPEWVTAGGAIGPRSLPLSEGNTQFAVPLDLADCVVASAPYEADYFFRTAESSPEETEALQALVPAIEPCLPQGLQMTIQPQFFRQWIGEGLWHAANHSRPGA